MVTEPHPRDARVRAVRLTDAGLAERAQLDRLSDRSPSRCSNRSTSISARLVAAMREVERCHGDPRSDRRGRPRRPCAPGHACDAYVADSTRGSRPASTPAAASRRPRRSCGRRPGSCSWRPWTMSPWAAARSSSTPTRRARSSACGSRRRPRPGPRTPAARRAEQQAAASNPVVRLETNAASTRRSGSTGPVATSRCRLQRRGLRRPLVREAPHRDDRSLPTWRSNLRCVQGPVTRTSASAGPSRNSSAPATDASTGSRRTLRLALAFACSLDGSWGFAGSELVEEAEIRRVVGLPPRTPRRPDRSRPSRSRSRRCRLIAKTGGHRSRTDPFSIATDVKATKLLAINETALSGRSQLLHVTHALCARREAVRQQPRQPNCPGAAAQRAVFRGHGHRPAVRPVCHRASLAAPRGEGYEYIEGYDFLAEAGVAAREALTKARGEIGYAGKFDLVLDPTNLWLTIDESVGHSTELDRALGWEANFAGTSS